MGGGESRFPLNKLSDKYRPQSAHSHRRTRPAVQNCRTLHDGDSALSTTAFHWTSPWAIAVVHFFLCLFLLSFLIYFWFVFIVIFFRCLHFLLSFVPYLTITFLPLCFPFPIHSFPFLFISCPSFSFFLTFSMHFFYSVSLPCFLCSFPCFQNSTCTEPSSHNHQQHIIYKAATTVTPIADGCSWQLHAPAANWIESCAETAVLVVKIKTKIQMTLSGLNILLVAHFKYHTTQSLMTLWTSFARKSVPPAVSDLMFIRVSCVESSILSEQYTQFGSWVGYKIFQPSSGIR